MPTGYTATLMRDGQTFSEFVLGCARAFGPLISMRDAPHDAKIPKKIKTDCSYNRDGLKSARKKLARFSRMSKKAALAFGERERASQTADYQKYRAEKLEGNAKLEAMRQQVEAWVPPTSEHANLRAFMLQQLDISKDSTDYYDRELEKLAARGPLDYYQQAFDKAKSDIEYFQKEIASEKHSDTFATTWVTQLRKSVQAHEKKIAKK